MVTNVAGGFDRDLILSQNVISTILKTSWPMQKDSKFISDLPVETLHNVGNQNDCLKFQFDYWLDQDQHIKRLFYGFRMVESCPKPEQNDPCSHY